LAKYDSTVQAYTTAFFGCGTPAQLTINGFNSATGKGTVTGTDYATGEDNKTVTVSAGLTGTGKVKEHADGGSVVTPDFTVAFHGNSIGRAASGPLNISGDLSFSTAASDVNDSGIGRFIEGWVLVEKN
jgi:hypothetical protein